MAIPKGHFGDYLLKKEESLKTRSRKRRVYKAKIADSTSNWGKTHGHFSRVFPEAQRHPHFHFQTKT